MSSKVDSQRFLAITASLRWAEIQEIVDACDRASFWSDDFLESAVNEAKKSLVRRLMGQVRDREGHRVFHSVETHDPETGETVKRYMQEALFEVDDYRVVVTYHRDREQHHGREARRLNERCRQKYGISVLPGFEVEAA